MIIYLISIIPEYSFSQVTDNAKIHKNNNPQCNNCTITPAHPPSTEAIPSGTNPTHNPEDDVIPLGTDPTPSTSTPNIPDTPKPNPQNPYP